MSTLGLTGIRIPDGWQVVPAGYLFRREKRVGWPQEQLLSVYRDHGVVPKDSRDDNFNKASEDLSSYQLVEPNDLVINKMKAWQGSVGISAHRGIVSPAYFVASPTRGFFRRYVHYLLRCSDYLVEYQTRSAGIRVNQWDLDWDDFRAIPIALPPAEDQERIANFLDEQTARIDSLIAEKQKLLQLLSEYASSVLGEVFTCGREQGAELRRTGIEWLPTVPATWKLTKLMAVSSVVRGASPRPAGDPRFFAGDHIPWVTVAEITKDERVYLTETATRLTAEGEQLSRRFRAGTLLLSNSGATLGVPKILTIDACANDGVVGFERLSPQVLPLFAYYYLRSLTESLRERIRQGAGQPNLNTTIVKSLPLPLPDLSEQGRVIELVQRLDERSQELALHVQQHIERLCEYRSSLISAAVTGQLDLGDSKTWREERLAA